MNDSLEPLTIPPLPFGEVVDLRDYQASDGETYFVEIRRMRRSGRYFAHYERPCGGVVIDARRWSYGVPSMPTVQRAFNMAKRHIEFILEDRPGWCFENEDGSISEDALP